MNDTTWKKAATEADIGEQAPYATTVDKTDIFIIKRGDTYYAVENTCPHYGAALTDGVIDEHTVTCPWHHARFELEAGTLKTPPALDDLQTFDVTVEDGDVFIRPGASKSIQMPEGSDSRRILIVGAGAAGNACAETLRREGFVGQITLLTADGERPYDRPMLSKGFIKGMAEESWLPLRSEEFYDSLHIDILTNRRVDAVDIDNLEVHCDTGDRYGASRIVLATGGRPRRLNIRGSEKSGVFTLRSAADARRIRERAASAETAVIIGAGFIGMELASDLRQRGLAVHVVAPESLPMSLMFGDEIGAVMKNLHEGQGVEFHLGTKPKEILGEAECHEVRLFDDSTIEADLIVAGLGVEPALSFLSNTDLASDHGVEVDHRLETTRDGLFAAGDIAAVPYPSMDAPQRIEHWVVAEAQGRHVARSILGDTEAYSTIPFFWTRQYDTSLKYIGYAEPGMSARSRGSLADHDGIVGFFSEGRLIGAAGIGRMGELLDIRDSLAAGKTIDASAFD